MLLLEFSMFPLGKGESVSADVAHIVEIIDRSGLDYRLHAMGTIVEGEVDAVLALLQECLHAMASRANRVMCTAKLDYRKGYQGRLDAKVRRIEEHLHRPLPR